MKRHPAWTSHRSVPGTGPDRLLRGRHGGPNRPHRLATIRRADEDHDHRRRAHTRARVRGGAGSRSASPLPPPAGSRPERHWHEDLAIHLAAVLYQTWLFILNGALAIVEAPAGHGARLITRDYLDRLLRPCAVTGDCGSSRLSSPWCAGAHDCSAGMIGHGGHASAAPLEQCLRKNVLASLLQNPGAQRFAQLACRALSRFGGDAEDAATFVIGLNNLAGLLCLPSWPLTSWRRSVH